MLIQLFPMYPISGRGKVVEIFRPHKQPKLAKHSRSELEAIADQLLHSGPTDGEVGDLLIELIKMQRMEIIALKGRS